MNKFACFERINTACRLEKCLGVFAISAALGVTINPFNYVVNAADIVSTKSFSDFIGDLEATPPKISRVVFKGVNPEYCIGFYTDGSTSIIKEGFPAYDDPRSPSGPAQAIAKCQVAHSRIFVILSLNAKH